MSLQAEPVFLSSLDYGFAIAILHRTPRIVIPSPFVA
jgi:hypothetical protein